MPKFAIILPAAGSSQRFKDAHYKKPFAILAERAVWLHAIDPFLQRDDVVQRIIVIAEEDQQGFRDKFAANAAIMGIDLVPGGATRTESVANALSRLDSEIEYVAIHDAARPCLAAAWVDDVFAAAVQHGAAILAHPIVGTVKRVQDHRIETTVDRSNLWEAQTPQVFRRELLEQAYAEAGDQPATDDAELVERLGHPVAVVPGSLINLKITTKSDLRVAAQLLKAVPKAHGLGPLHPFQDDQLWS